MLSAVSWERPLPSLLEVLLDFVGGLSVELGQVSKARWPAQRQ